MLGFATMSARFFYNDCVILSQVLQVTVCKSSTIVIMVSGVALSTSRLLHLSHSRSLSDWPSVPGIGSCFPKDLKNAPTYWEISA